jgi:hypothetical protein
MAGVEVPAKRSVNPGILRLIDDLLGVRDDQMGLGRRGERLLIKVRQNVLPTRAEIPKTTVSSGS